MKMFYLIASKTAKEQGWRSRYSDWLRAGRQRGRSSSPGKVKNFLSPHRRDRFWGPPASYPVGTGEGSFPLGKEAGA
jgi:hypothetical protein